MSQKTPTNLVHTLTNTQPLNTKIKTLLINYISKARTNKIKSTNNKVGIFSKLLGETFSQTFKLEAGKVDQEFSFEGVDFIPFSSCEIYFKLLKI